NLIGDDEHGWTPNGVFNFEGGCYAKCIDLSAEKEPQIWSAIRFGTLLENTEFYPGTRSVDYASKRITENTRAAYPLHYIPGAVEPSVGGVPKNIFFLTADAFGVLPPISKLSVGQAMFQFLSGYTAKVAGTEAGVLEPQATFSACYGQVFLPLHPTKYAEMLGEKLRTTQVNVWLINTGWTGGPYGVGSRMKLPFTRAMIAAALAGKLDSVAYTTDPVFGLSIPNEVPGVPAEVLNPRSAWADPAAYDLKAAHLAQLFNDNFAKFSDFASDEIKAAAPRILVV
ncbi:MAG: phosphoenolpyruvate carboxykinase (ATP), partial [Bacteroidia bacterium]|nr:phosphoenolpyruvate carboxykinase (ATP) [Bacteroidia bacterium]